MPAIVIIIFYFVFTSFVINYQGELTNFLLAYYDLHLRFLLDHLIIFIIIFFILTIVFIRRVRGKNKLGKYSVFIQKIFALTFIGSFISYAGLFLIAFIHLNSLSILSNINLNILGVKADTDAIFGQLEISDSSPKIIFDDENSSIALKTIALSQSGGNHFYGQHIIPNIPNMIVLPSKNTNTDVLLVGNYLIVKEINSSDFQKVSPVVSYLMIKDYFPKTSVKKFPSMTLVGKEKYIDFRKENIEDKLRTIDELKIKLDENIEELTLIIDEQEVQLTKEEEKLQQEKDDKEKEYSKCVNEGYYEDGVYQKVNTKEYCREQFNEKDELIKEIADGVEDLKASIENNRKKISNNQEYLKFYGNQQLLAKEEANFIVDEYAVFNPPDIIKITQTADNSPRALADYFAVLIHEYLHYTTYNEEGESLESLFFTEGLTEYFARKIVEKNFGIETNLAYPVNVKIIEQMMKRIAESDIAFIYFNNDAESLEKLIDMVYEEDFYSENLITLETLQYSGESERILSLANEVMEKIGGEPLTKEDVISDNDTFH